MKFQVLSNDNLGQIFINRIVSLLLAYWFLWVRIVCFGMLFWVSICLSAQDHDRFPAFLEFKVYNNRQFIGKARMSYNENTGIRHFNREIASLRMYLYPEGVNDLAYVKESYFFRDDLSLFSQNTINVEGGIISEITLQDVEPEKRYVFRDAQQVRFRDSGQCDVVIDELSSSFLAAVRFGESNGRDNIYQFISSDGSYRPMRFLCYSKSEENIGGRKVSTVVVSLVSNNVEIHRYKLAKSEEGYYFPVAINFNVNDAGRNMEYQLESFPLSSRAQNSDEFRVVYLDFMESKSQSIRNQTEIDKIVHGFFYEQIEKEINSMVLNTGKTLMLDMPLQRELNNQSKIKQLIDITFDENLGMEEKMNRIGNFIGGGGKADMIVTGQYIDGSGSSPIKIRPILININNSRIDTQSIDFNRSQLLGTASAVSKYSQSGQPEDYIRNEIKRFFSSGIFLTGSDSEKVLTLMDVYRTVIKKKLFCHAVEYGYHYDVLEHLRQSDGLESVKSIDIKRNGTGEAARYEYVFKNGWEVHSEAESNRSIIKTISANMDNYAKVLTLYWDIVEGQETSYDDALRKIEELNKSKNEGFSDWRLPTLEEVLSITSDKSSRPFYFPFQVSSTITNKIWTSTRLAANDAKFFGHNRNDAYFVLKRLDIEKPEKVEIDIIGKNEKAFFLPVRSPLNSGNQLIKSGNKAYSIANLPFLNLSGRSPLASGELKESIDKAISRGINMVSVFNSAFIIQNPTSFYTEKNENLLAEILFDPNMVKEKKVKRMIDELMTPNGVDILVTGFFIDDGHGDMITIRPAIINRYSQSIATENLQFKRSEFTCSGSGSESEVLCEQNADKISEKVKALLERT